MSDAVTDAVKTHTEPRIGPCPFCGSRARLYTIELNKETTHYQVCCMASDATFLGTEGVGDEYCAYENEYWFDSEAEAVQWWNERPVENRLRRALKRTLEKIAEMDAIYQTDKSGYERGVKIATLVNTMEKDLQDALGEKHE